MKTFILLAISLLIALPTLANDIDDSLESLESTIMNMKSGTKTTGEWFMSLSQTNQIELISGFIDMAKEHKVSIERSPLFYLKELYTEYDANPSQLQYPVGTLIKVIAQTYGDWKEEGKTEQEVFKETFGDGWKDAYNRMLGVRKKIKEAGVR